jgi:hypothetical protein
MCENLISKIYSDPDRKKILTEFDAKKYLIAIFGQEKANEITGDGLDEPYFDD